MKILMSAVLILIIWTPHLYAKTEHVVYFEQTDHELHVFHIRGKKPGKTMMIIGGIQGDEPGGYLAADLYADISLRSGNIILVPRANFLSILKNKRQVNVDMNRRFSINNKNEYEDTVVNTLQSLLKKSDVFLNLHEGSGFYRSTWIDKLKNPKRFGQSIIADAAVATVKKKELRLQEMASVVVSKVNEHIDNPEYHFRFNNHNTASTESAHKEQRNSATYYAVYELGIPAFGIETSKNIRDLTQKVKMQSMIINSFMELFGIEQENPSIHLATPQLNYALIHINGRSYQVVKPGGTLILQQGDEIRFEHLAANYSRGLTVDIDEGGGAHDLNREIKINKSTWAHFRKDKFNLGKIRIQVVQKSEKPTEEMSSQVAQNHFYNLKTHGDIEALVIRVNKRPFVIRRNETFSAKWGDAFQIVGSLSVSNQLHADLIHNFVGYYGGVNGIIEDDTGLNIRLKKSDLLKRFSEDKTGSLFRVTSQDKSHKYAHFYVRLH